MFPVPEKRQREWYCSQKRASMQKEVSRHFWYSNPRIQAASSILLLQDIAAQPFALWAKVSYRGLSNARSTNGAERPGRFIMQHHVSGKLWVDPPKWK